MVKSLAFDRSFQAEVLMKNLLLLPEQLFLKRPELLKAAMVLNSDAQPLARAGNHAELKDSKLLRIGGYAIETLSTLREDLSWQGQQIFLNSAQGTVIVLKFQQFYLLLLVFPNYDEQIRILLKQIENFLVSSYQDKELREKKLPSHLVTTPKIIEEKPKKITWDGDIFLTRCERELSRSLDCKLVKILMTKYYSLACKNRTQFLQALGQRIRDPIERNSFLEVMQPFG